MLRSAALSVAAIVVAYVLLGSGGPAPGPIDTPAAADQVTVLPDGSLQICDGSSCRIIPAADMLPAAAEGELGPVDAVGMPAASALVASRVVYASGSLGCGGAMLPASRVSACGGVAARAVVTSRPVVRRGLLARRPVRRLLGRVFCR